jgi:hypothetical protein
LAATLFALPRLSRGDTTATWLSASSGNWTSTSAWSTQPNYPNNGTPPGTNYLAVIAAAGSPYTVTLNSDVVTDGLTLNSANATLDHTAGTLTAPINLDAGTYQLNGGTIANSTVTISGGSLVVQNGTLNGVTVNGADLQVNGNLYVRNGLTLGTHNLVPLNENSYIYFDGPSQVLNNINIVPQMFAWVSVSGPTSPSPVTLTLGNNTTVHSGAYFYDLAYGLNLGYNGSSLVNNGTINADTRGGWPVGINTSNFTNNTLAEATNGGTLDIGATNWINASGGIVTADASTLVLGGTWSNAGTISATNGSYVELGGHYTTAGIGKFIVSADSTVVLNGDGYLDNTGAILKPANYGGIWNIGGTIANGTIDVGGGSLYVHGATLSGVTVINGDLQVDEYLQVQNGINLSGHNMYLTRGTMIDAFGSQTWDNLNVVGTGGDNISLGESSTFTLGSHATMQGIYQLGGETLINNDTIDSDLYPELGTYTYVANLINNGILEATNGSTLYISTKSSDGFPANYTFTNHGIVAVHNGTIQAPGGLAVNDGTLTGSGTIIANVTLSSDPSTLAFNIGGRNQGTDYDSLTIQGNMALGGNLELTLTNGFIPADTDTFTVLMLQAGQGFALSGSFLNVADGGRLVTTDGLGSFQVLYGSGAFANEIVLENFQAIPEPSCLALLAVAPPVLLARRKRTVRA